MWNKSYQSMYTGSMVGAGLAVWGVWNFVVTTGKNGYIDLNPDLLAAILGCSPKEMELAIAKLCEADPKSRGEAEGGKRLIREGQFQYKVVNWGRYQEIQSAEQLRAYNRKKQAEYRARKKLKSVPGASEILHKKQCETGEIDLDSGLPNNEASLI